MYACCKKLLLSAVLVFAVSAQLFAQINLSVKGKDIRSVLQQIERTTNYRFFFGDIPGLKSTVSLDVKDAGITEVLDKILEGTGIAYTITDYQIVLKESSNKAETQEAPDQVRGRVVDEAGVPLPGVFITVKGNTRASATISDADGNFTLSGVPPRCVLVFQMLGFNHKEVTTGAGKNLKVVLTESREMLDDVVVIGYGSLEKRELTSSITSLKNKDFIGGNSQSPLVSLVGKVPGLDIYSSAGSDPNTDISIQLRGVNSIKADQGPLVVVDGVPGGNMNILQKEDIVSVDVLKDASAAAIYGTRASGGVILVTTRMGSEGRVRVNYTAELTSETILNRAEMLSADEWRELGYDDYGANTDWFSAITRTPFTQRHMLSMSGGSGAFSSYASFFYKNAQGMTIGSDRRELGGRFNFSYKALQNRLELSGRASYVDIASNYTDSGIFRDALTLNPTFPVYNAEDPSGYNILAGNDEWNPVANINLKEDKSQNDRLQASLSAKLTILKGWTTTLTAGITQNIDNNAYWESALHRRSRDNNRAGYASQSWSRGGSTNLEWITNYDLRLQRHSLKAVAGYSFQQTGMTLSFNGSNADFSNDGSKMYNMGDGKYLVEGRSSIGSYKSPRERLISFFGRVNYTFDDRYLLMASIRYEGSSKFGDNNKWGVFPSLSVAWRLSSEPFMRELTWLNDLRIRAGVGVTGNQGFSPGVTTRMYKSDTDPYFFNGKWITTYGLAKNVNYDLQWETKTEYNLGLDFALFENRLGGKLDVYRRLITNLIYDIDVAQPPAVYPTTTKNVGGMENVGWELELFGVPVKTRGMQYTTTLRFSSNKSRLLALWGEQNYYDTVSFPSPGSPGTAVRLAPGQEIGRFFIWKYAGIDDEGNWLLYDNDDNVIKASEKTIEDKRYIGHSIPKLVMSWDNSFTWRNFDLSVFFRSWIGHDVFNMTEMYYGLPNVVNKNVLRSAFRKNAEIRGEKELCDYFLQDGSFLKLDALTLGYTIPCKKLVDSVRLSLTGRNLFCLTAYTGLDPEINSTGLTPGFEGLYMYPRTRVFTFGVNVQF